MRWDGKFIITSISNSKTETIEINNMITNIGLNFLRDALKGDVTDAEFKYLAVGTSSITVSATNTQLFNEIFRTQFTSLTAGTDGVLNSTAIILDNEAVAQIEEVGIFAGSTASSSTNSGIMISRILYSRNKTNLESLQFNRVDTIGRS